MTDRLEAVKAALNEAGNELWLALAHAHRLVGQFRDKHGRDPSEAELRVMATLFIEQNKRERTDRISKERNGGDRAPGDNEWPEACEDCGQTDFWDNRAKKASGEYKANSPDFKCKNCSKGVWLKGKKKKGKPAASEPEPEPEPEPDYEDDLPF